MSITDKHNIRISIQVGLSGYSFIRETDKGVSYSGWMSADRIFTSPELQSRYGQVEIGLFTPKFTLVPKHFHSPRLSAEILSDVSAIEESDVVDYVDVPEFGAVLVYSNTIGGSLSKVLSQSVLRADGSQAVCLPYIYYMLRHLSSMAEYNKIVAAYADNWLYLVIAQGRTLLLCNCFPAPDFTTAEYYIFHSLKKLQLNPEISSIVFRTPLSVDQEMSLYRYFKNVDVCRDTM